MWMGRKGQAEKVWQNIELDRHNWTGRKGQAAQDRQKKLGRTRLPGQDCQDKIPGQDCQHSAAST